MLLINNFTPINSFHSCSIFEFFRLLCVHNGNKQELCLTKLKINKMCKNNKVGESKSLSMVVCCDTYRNISLNKHGSQDHKACISFEPTIIIPGMSCLIWTSISTKLFNPFTASSLVEELNLCSSEISVEPFRQRSTIWQNQTRIGRDEHISKDIQLNVELVLISPRTTFARLRTDESGNIRSVNGCMQIWKTRWAGSKTFSSPFD